MKNIGKPCAGKPHARFDEGRQAKACFLLYPFLASSHDLDDLALRPPYSLDSGFNNAKMEKINSL